MANQPGRPKSAKTLENERIEALLKNPHIRRMTKQKRKELEKQFAASKEIEKQIYAGHSPTIPHDLILAIESLGDRELFEEDDWIIKSEQKTIEKYSTLVEAEKLGQQMGGQVTAEKAMARAKVVWGKNQDLIDKIGRKQTLHSVAQKLHDEWDTRGDGAEKPSLNTIKNWYQKII